MEQLKDRISLFWGNLIGDADEFSIDNRAFNAISIISIIILLFLLPINIYLGLPFVWASVAITMGLLIVLYYYARYRKQYAYSMSIYAAGSYLLLVLNFFFNAGADGPTIFLFFLSFQLLIAFTPQRQHLTWAILHIVLTVSLLYIHYWYPEWIMEQYAKPSDRCFDLSTSALIILACMYCITIYLRSNYNRETRLSAEHARQIEEQNQQIRLQYQELEKLGQEKNKLISVLGQDLRGPLNSISSVLELLTTYPVPEQRARELQKGLLQTTRNTSDILTNLLTWTSRQMKGMTVSLQRVRLLEIVQQVLASQQSLSEAKSITVQVDISDSIYIMADPDMLVLVLRNILNNALKFTGNRGLIEMAAEERGNSCVITITDNGIGMFPEQLAQLFSMNIHSTFGTNNEKGIGLGLVLCKDFTEAQGGTIHAHSEEGVGTVLSVSLPLYKGISIV
ncbi:HAMP domain-containing sensor histidine kinase [Rurimicrobium arvi]|uniref:histidine kinase n=1 Tax=Rurimicrobium arvi TaxID=2049916 RepID=A0ABP8MH63_9BACT